MDTKIFHRWFVRLNHEYLIQLERCERRIKRQAWRGKNFFIHQIELNECYLRYVARKQELLNALANLGK